MSCRSGKGGIGRSIEEIIFFLCVKRISSFLPFFFFLPSDFPNLIFVIRVIVKIKKKRKKCKSMARERMRQAREGSSNDNTDVSM